MCSVGSALQKQLQDSSAPLHDSMGLMRHIIEHKIDGHVRQLLWLHEDSTLKHEYLILSIILPGDDRPSWLRVERLGAIASGYSDTATKHARLEVIVSPRYSDLLNDSDEIIQSVEFHSDPPSLIDLAQFIVILYEEVPEVTLTNYNCWWFAWRIFVVLVKKYLPGSPQKEQMIKSTVARFFGYSVDAERLCPKSLIYSAFMVLPTMKICLQPDTPNIFRWLQPSPNHAAMKVLATEMRIHIRLRKYIPSNTGARRTAQQETYAEKLPGTTLPETS